MRKLFLFVLLCPFVANAHTDLRTELKTKQGSTYFHEFIEGDNGQRVETYWTTPNLNEQKPLVVLIHGHQKSHRMGGRQYFTHGRIFRLAHDWDMNMVAVSQVGYGNSQGLPDACGPKTQDAVVKVIEEFKKRSHVDPEKIFIIGYSRGASVAGMVSTKLPYLKGAVMAVGFYDLEDFYNRLPPELQGIKDNIDQETGGVTATVFKERSLLKNLDVSKVPVFMIHGEQDERGGIPQARQVLQYHQKAGIKSELHIYPEAGHAVPIQDFYAKSKEFIDRMLAN